ncbi:ABC transporter ATP-binding protein [Streptosporangium sp. NPDC049248]|uniref:ABC transporter ATP-binding protein/permease n=1 Tax=Streptosporangium sp. NPDC049248 TaxID=3155651 RepID=UPI00344686EA
MDALSAEQGASPAPPKPESLMGAIRGRVLWSVLGTWSQALATTALLLLVGAAIGEIAAGRTPSSGLIIGLVAAAALRALFAALIPAVTIRAGGFLEVSLRARIYRHLLRLGAPLRSREQSGQLVSTATEAVELVATYYATFLGPILASMTVPVLVLAAIALFVDPWAALVIAIAVPAIPLTVGIFERSFAKVSAGYRDTANRLAARFLDALQGLSTLKLFNQGTAHGRTLASASEDLRRAIMRLLAGNQVILFVVDTVFSLGMITAATVLAMVRLDEGAIGIGEAVALVLLATQLVEPLDKVGQFFYIGMGGSAAAKEIKRLLAERPSVPDPATPAPDGAPAEVEFHGVSFAYDPGSPVLRDVSFRIAPGEKLALVGPSGSGKSTAAALLQRNIAAGEGVVSIGGHNVTEVPGDWVREQITVVAQTTYLFTGTLRDNLRVAAPGADDDRLWQALRTANLDEFVRGLPEGLDTPTGERGLMLSGGQAQRVAIARAVLKDAPILILDEPTSNVDLESEAAILSALDRLAVGRTVLVIAHRLATVRDADHIVVLEDGRVTEHGTHDELLSGTGHYARAMRRTEAETGS